MGQNSGPSGKRYKREYRALVKAGVENAMTKGYLFGFPIDKTKRVAIIPDRGKVVWPDAPKGLMRQWWRWKQIGHHPLAEGPHIATRHRAELASMREARAAHRTWRQDALPVSG